MSKRKLYKNVIGLINPASNWHKDSNMLLGAEIDVIEIHPAYNFKGWYSATVKLINPPKGFEVIANKMTMRCFRPRRILIK